MWLSMLKASSEISFLPVCSSQYMDLVLLSFDLTSKLSTWKLSSLILGEAFCLLLLPGVLRLSIRSFFCQISAWTLCLHYLGEDLLSFT